MLIDVVDVEATHIVFLLVGLSEHGEFLLGLYILLEHLLHLLHLVYPLFQP